MAKRPARKRRKSAKTTRRKRTTRSSRSAPRPWWRRLKWRYPIAAAVLTFVGYAAYLNYIIQDQFEAKRWSLPARVYARPLELYAGLPLSARHFEQELRFAGYRPGYQPKVPGSYMQQGNRFELITRSFQFWDGYEPSRHIEVVLSDGRVDHIDSLKTDSELDLVRLDPAHIGGIYPTHHEDRILVQLAEVPKPLRQMIIDTEDRQFYSHHGLDFRAIARALWANIRAGATVQGGSTITQQLVKNFFLDNRRTLWRKFNEAIMAVLLEMHYGKEEILESYINEVYLGQQGQRGIHGFGLASRYYFDKSIDKLNLAEMATLVALVRGPGYYNPERHPKRLLERRNRILEAAKEHGILTTAQARQAEQRGLGVVADNRRAITAFPAFMDLVKRQLQQYYRHQDLTTAGLQIFTTLDPFIQRQTEAVLKKRVDALDRRQGLKGALQGAAIVTGTSGGEVLALVGGRNPRFAGFDRALDAARPIGSLMKPAIYLAAVQQPEKYNLLTPIEDAPLQVDAGNGKTWSPDNYDGRSHGEVFLYQALIHSYNQATVRLGMDLGFSKVIDVLHRMGVERNIPAYPSMLLGAVELTPFEVGQMYQTLASGGFRTPLRAIREVLTAEGEPLRRYPLKVEQAFDPASTEVITSALMQVVQRGTAQSVRRYIPPELRLAGKTGTTDDTRDSWFAGYSANHLAVVWLGLDNNEPTGLTGASGALRVWGDIMDAVPSQTLTLASGENVVVLPVNPQTGLVGGPGCDDNVTLAFMKGTAPEKKADCAGGGLRDKVNGTLHWFKGLFD
jgi:penicillin-binding protein 1B